MRDKNRKKERQNRTRPDRGGVNATGVCGTRILPEARSMAHPPTVQHTQPRESGSEPIRR